jgi:hypothetical protein
MAVRWLFERYKTVASILLLLLSTEKTTARGRQSNKSKAMDDGYSPAKTPRKRATPKKKKGALNKVKNSRVAKSNGKGKGATSSFGEETATATVTAR